ncbi:phosphoribosylamine--glycine ligase [Desulfurobacterium indicum]|uniref:Phosphoribosylamine--glycine ligase n=1 Tax=Desulfurobacterium indicum TaxID=1914305 RepID=A0A1R1ML70_9BACT|nr:phosphoribosylamine--glycine ligase [Desulfurobacterium indicum]OMH40460.1 phosphoribosylamine--glycine ligase [Desulfurobacterium indicum]
MKVLVIGSGGREHALTWKISKSKYVKEIFAIPGNPGIAQLATCITIDPTNIKAIADFAEREKINLTVVGPEAPLVAGIVDEFESRGLKIFGPSKEAARLEGSKAFSKEMMKAFGVPTAEFQIFDNPEDAKAYIKEKGAPIVVKADGLAAGKGVVVAQTVEEALEAIDKIMVDRVFGDAGNRVVVEECLKGEEASYLVISDGERYIPLAPAQDHKAVFDGDRGPNTGGMGAYSPAPVLSPELEEEVKKRVIEPMLKGMAERGTPFKGILYAGIMVTENKGIQVLEFNVRFGDPEAQVILRRMKTDLVELCKKTIEGNLPEKIDWDERTAICVVLASKGYPGKYEKGKVITGIEEAEKIDDVVVFHAGTATKNGKLVTNGGRVLNVTAMGKDIHEAIDNVYRAVDKIHFDGMHYRKDIGAKALKER